MDTSNDERLSRYRATREKLGQQLIRSRVLDAGFKDVLETIGDGMGWEIVMLWLPKDGELECRDIWQQEDLAAPALPRALAPLRLAAGEGMAGRAWLTGATEWAEDLTMRSRFPILTIVHDEVIRRIGTAPRGAASVPIPGSEGTIGALQLFSADRRKPDHDLLTLMESIASMVGNHIERERDAEALRVARDAAEAASQAKSEFVSRITHELRTPLNAVIGFGQLLERDAPTASQREQAGQILRAGGHLLALIDDLLDVARLEHGQLRTSPEPVPATEVLREALELAQPMIDARGLALELDVHAGMHRYVVADYQRLRQVLLNLLSNAIKYNRPHGRIIVAISDPAPGRLRISVTDTGHGIAPRHLPRLFAPFERLGAGSGETEMGTGLGLTVSKGLIEAMGGTIDVDSVLGEGSTFRIDLPLADAPAPPPGDGAVAPRSPAGGLPPGTILCVEDNPANLKLMESIFADHPGIRLLTTMRGGPAIELAQRHRPDLILLDVHLPDIGGDEVARRLKAEAATASIPIIVLSAEGSRERRREFLAAGALDYILKPIDVGRFLARVGEVLGTTTAPPLRGRPTA